MEKLDKPFYSPKQVAELLGVHPSTVLTYIRAGELHAIRISQRTIRIPNRALRRFLGEDPGYSVAHDPAEVELSEADREEG